MKPVIPILAGAVLLSVAPLAVLAAAAGDDAGLAALQQQIDTLKHQTERRLQRMEKHLRETQKATRIKKANAFNPAISLILNGNLTAYRNNPDDYRLPGFALGGEAGLEAEGFSLGESEVTLGANVDQQFYGQATFSLADDGGETSISTEEAYFETLAMPWGLKIKAGRFYSALGYINGKHAHAWDFNDAPLAYRGLFGNQLKQDGAQLSWLLPTEHYVLLGAEVGNGLHYPSAGSHANIGDWTAYLKTGGDIGLSHSWQLGVSHWQANDVQGRSSQGMNSPAFDGDSRVDAVDFVYKWAPDGNPLQRNLKLQAEFFQRRESGVFTLLDSKQASTYDGKQQGWYAQAVYQFAQQWKVGLRYDRLRSDNSGSDAQVLEQAGLLDHGHRPHRISLMLAWRPSEFSRIRAQFNRDDSTTQSDNQFLLQYTMVMGAHGAHSY